MSDAAERIARLSPEQRALLEAKLRAAAPVRPRAREPIAIVGAGCRLPGGVESPDAFRRLLLDGIDTIAAVPRERWDAEAFHDPDRSAPGKMVTRVGAFLDRIDAFDAGFFGISPREAEQMDPQQRLLLETAVDALEDAGLPLERLVGSETGVFVGAHGHSSDYLWMQYADPARVDAFTGTGTAHNMLAGRLSYLFDLHGPAVVVDTACSSSLVAVHLAVQSLRAGESDVAIAAGVNAILWPHFSIITSNMGMLSEDGRCKAFDQRADGIGRGEGCGVVVLKRLSDALAAGDPIRAVIRGSATNQDGRTNGITAPSGRAQREVIERALKDGGVDASAVGYLEAHGTGTPLGDPIEIEAIAATVGRPAPDAGELIVGSAKTNIGHLESAAGIAGLIKAMLVVEHGEVPANLHFTGLNPHIRLEGSRIALATRARTWAPSVRPRVAGVSSFSWSGTNAHVVLEQPPARPTGPAHEAGALLLPVSARSPEALDALIERYLARLDGASDAQAAAVCRTAAQRRSHHDLRRAFAAPTAAALRDAIRTAGHEPPRSASAGAPRLVMVFGGQGSQWAGMGRGLLDAEPVFRDAVARVDAALAPLTGWSLEARLRAGDVVGDIDVVQPVLFGVQVALAALWRAWGVTPDAVVGHSMGEVAAACVAGALDLPSACRVIAARSRLLRRIAGQGAMLLVELPYEDARRACEPVADRVSVAGVNGLRTTVLAGDPGALETLAQGFESQGTFARTVKIDVASHSPQVEPLLEPLRDALAGLAPTAGEVAFYSTVTGDRHDGDGLDAAYWARNLREPVRFLDATNRLLEAGHDFFLEVGPHPVLLPAIGDALSEAGTDAVAATCGRRDQDEPTAMRAAAARLYERGAVLRWTAIQGAGEWTVLPAYPWQRQRYWLRDAAGVPVVPGAAVPGSGRGASAPDAVAACIHGIDWVQVPGPIERLDEAPGDWIVLADRAGVGPALAERLEAGGHRVHVVFAAGAGTAARRAADEAATIAAALDAALADGTPLLGIAHLWNLDSGDVGPEPASQLDAQVDGCASVASLVRTVVARNLSRPPRIVLVTRGAQPVGSRGGDPVQAPVWGFGRVLAEEHPECWGGLLDLDPREDVATGAAEIESCLLAARVEDGVARDGGRRFVPRLARDALAAGTEQVRCNPARTYLVTGGLGVVGLTTARWLVDRGARRVVLAGRSRPPSAEALAGATPDSPLGRRRAAIAALEATGAAVDTISLDVTDAAAVDALIESVGRAGAPLGGVVHSVMAGDDGLIVDLTAQALFEVMRPKVIGAAVLERACRGLELDFFVLHASIGGVLGQAGHAGYAAANAYLDVLAHAMRAAGTPATSVDWGVWEGADIDKTVGRARGIQALERRGVAVLERATGLAALDRLVLAGRAQAIVAPVDWARFGEVAARTRVPSIALGMLTEAAPAAPGAPAAPAAPAAPRFADELRDLPAERRREAMVVHLAGLLSRVLRLDVSQVDADKPMGTLGLESVTALELRKRIEDTLGLKLSTTVMWNFPTPNALAAHLVDRLAPGPGPGAPASENGQAPAVAAPAGAAVTEEDAVRRLAQRRGGRR